MPCCVGSLPLTATSNPILSSLEDYSSTTLNCYTPTGVAACLKLPLSCSNNMGLFSLIAVAIVAAAWWALR